VVTDLLDPDLDVRVAAARRCEDPMLLRTVLFCDEDARARAAAARRLGALRDERAIAWLDAALDDALPIVRAAALAGLARLRSGQTLMTPRIELALFEDPRWWVRRAAALALGVIAGPAAIDTLRRALGDPFWRVRYGALLALEAIGDDAPAWRALILAPPAVVALDYLRGRWEGHREVEPPRQAVVQDDGLRNPDPAVVLRRLLPLPDAPPAFLVESLGDPHEPLRDEAIRRLSSCADPRVLRAALAWLEPPGLPHAADATLAALARAPGSRALAETLVDDDAARWFELAWAIAWIAAAGDEELADAALRHAGHDEPRVRCQVALAAASFGRFSLVSDLAADPDVDVRAAAILRLRGERLARVPIASQRADVRRHLVEAAARERDLPRLELLGGDPDPRVRAAALGAAVRLGAALTLQLHDDEDPWIRAAALERADEAIARRLVADRDPWVRRAAVTRLERLGCAADECLADEDPWIRARAIAMTRGAVDPALLHDPSEIVRRAAADRCTEHLDRRLDELLAAPIEPAPAPAARPAPTPRPPGRTLAGIPVSELAISGVNELSRFAYDRAWSGGVNAFFFEQRYRSLAGFLRARRSAVVITGSYHGHRAGIEADVDAIRRRLRRDTLDVFLLFWARSAERIVPEVFGWMQELKRAGKVRAIGFSTHHREIAAEAIARDPWDVVMTRHSAAHPGAEETLLPLAASRGVSVIAFSSLCYGRMLDPIADLPRARAVDCYRYSIAQPAVSLALSAPRGTHELDENLEVIAAPALPAGASESLRRIGAAVRADNRRFHAMVRQPAAERLIALADQLELEGEEDRDAPGARTS
jgi:HEAT repeat protein